MSVAELEVEINALSQRAEKQKAVLRYFVQHPDAVEMRILLKNLNISAATVKALVEKRLIKGTESGSLPRPLSK